MARIAVMALGSAGDVNPFLGIGSALAARGHEVTFLTNPYFEDTVKAAQLSFCAIGTKAEFVRLLSHPDLWHPERGMDAIFRPAADWTCEQYQRLAALAALAANGLDVVVAPFQCFGARLANELLGIPLVTVLPNPILVESVYDPVHYPVLRLLSQAGPLAARLLYALVTSSFERIVRPRINRCRVSLGFAPLRRVSPWTWSPERVIGLWPSWLRGPQRDWAAQLRLTGFVHYDGPLAHEPESVVDDAFLAQRPIVFTPGTAITNAAPFFATALEAAQRLARPALFVTRLTAQLPQPLPDNIRHIAFAPFGALLPRCAAIIHHGGIGTAARALAAGIPQLLMPSAHDQFDNAHLLQRLGVAKSLPKRHFTAKRVAHALDALLSSPEVKESCETAAARLRAQDALAETCTLIESLIGRRKGS